MKSVPSRPILIVDDDPSAVELARHTLTQAGFEAPIDVRKRGTNAIAYLKSKLSAGKDALPFLLFLDLKMPGTDGFLVLDWIRRQPRLRRILTIVLRSSTNSCDVARACALGAKTYFGNYPVAPGVRTIFQLANSMLTIDEIEKFILPDIHAFTSTHSGPDVAA